MFKRKAKKKSEGKIAHTKQEIDGIKFDSGLEARMYLYLKAQKDVEILSVHHTLDVVSKQVIQGINKLAGFSLIGKAKNEDKMTELVYTPDFYIKYKGVDMYIEAKGLEDSSFTQRVTRYNSCHTRPLLIAKSIVGLEQLLKLVDKNLELISTIDGLGVAPTFNVQKYKDIVWSIFEAGGVVEDYVYKDYLDKKNIYEKALASFYSTALDKLLAFYNKTSLKLSKTLQDKILNKKILLEEIVDTFYKLSADGFKKINRIKK